MRLSIALLFFFVNHGYSQSVKSDTAFLAEAKKNAIQLYEDQMHGQSPLINGGSYNEVQLLNHDPDRLEESHPYFAFEWMEGTVHYGGEWYTSTFLYDISQDNLIMLNASQQKQLLLVKERIDEFTLGEYRFVKLNGKLSFQEGFYEIVYDGATKVYACKRKKLERVVGYDVDVPFKYVSKTTYYIRKVDQYFSVKNKRSVLRVLSESESELKEFLRSQHQSFNDNRAYFIGEMARLHDKLTVVDE